MTVKHLFFTTSWDDGSIYDLKLAEMLAKYGVKGTFYIPLKNEEIPTLSKKEIKLISNDFEIAGHTFNHVILTKVSLERARAEIRNGKNAIEDIIEKEIKAFCFPRGKYNIHLLQLIKECGFDYARTVKSLRVKNVIDAKKNLMHVTLQVYPHKHYVYWISILKGNGEGIKNYIRFVNVIDNWSKLAKMLFDFAYETNGAFHLWGHSWEIERYNLWGMLEDFFIYIKEKSGVVYCTNTELWECC